MTGRDSQQADPSAVEEITRRMQRAALPPLAIRAFLNLYGRLAAGDTGCVPGRSIAPPGPLAALDSLGDDAGAAALRRTVVIKLNGGLGTTMGLSRVKSLLTAREGIRFLDIVIGQALHLRRRSGNALPLILMNSFSSHEDTMRALDERADLRAGQPGIPPAFLQHRVPKIRVDNFLPVDWPADPSREWCPPGHGDLYVALQTTGLLEDLLARGIEYAFVSNIDNLGATLSLPILGYFAERDLPFLMEVTARTEADRKGGHLARHPDGRLLLRETAQCPAGEEDDFQDIARYGFFNTNNLWVNLKALRSRLAACGGLLPLTMIVNRKQVDVRDPASPAVYQIETAMGSAISLFAGADALRVPRARFAPVKSTDDLLVLRSDAYTMDDAMQVSPARGRATPPVVKLDPAFFGSYDAFEERFADGVPSLAECDSLVVEGDVRFGRNVRVKGRAEIRNRSRRPLRIADGAEISGTLSE
jgi:UTP--glucose-1-phosphate uridylyltransferase